MKKAFFSLVILLFTVAFAQANSIKEGNTISGHIIEKGSEENIPYAAILIVETGEGTSSNENGQFEFRILPPGNYTLRVSAMGYRTQEKSVTVSKQ